MLKKIFSCKTEITKDKFGIIISKYKRYTLFGIKFTRNCIPKDLRDVIKSLRDVIKDLRENYYRQVESMLFDTLRNLQDNFGFMSVPPVDLSEDERVNKLYENLSPQAKSHLDEILDMCHKLCTFKEKHAHLPMIEEVCSDEQLKRAKKAYDLKSEIKYSESEQCYTWNDYKLPTNFFDNFVFIDNYGIERLNTEIKDGAIIDVGAYIGDTALMFRKLFPKNQIIAFEPEKHNYTLLEKTIKLNNLENIKLEKIALGEDEYQANFNYLGFNGASSKVNYDNNGDKVNVTTLDKYVQENNLNVELIKTDIEGFEPKFLKGAENTIKTQCPSMLLSIYHNPEDFFGLKPYLENILKDTPYYYEFDFYQPITKISTCCDIVLICNPRKR